MALAERLGAWVTFSVKLAVGEKRGWESKTNKRVLCYRKSESFPLWESCSLAAGVPAACCPSCRATLPASSRGHAPASSAPLGGAFCPRARQAELSDSSSPTICGCSCCSFSLHLFPAFFSTVSAQSSVSVILVVIPASRPLVQLPFSHPISLRFLIHFISSACWLFLFSCARSWSWSGFSFSEVHFFPESFSCTSPVLSFPLNCCLLCHLYATKWTIVFY